MSLAGYILTLGFAGMMVLSVPFAFAIGSAVMLVLVFAHIEPAMLAQQVIAGAQSNSLLAIPLYMLAGELMTAGGMTQRLIDSASVLVRHRTGGLAMVTVVSALVFSAISGSAPATTAAIGAILIPAMTRAGYDKAFATGIAVSSGVLGPLIPPSIAFVVWGTLAEQSISDLFLSGIVPGLMIATGLLIYCYFYSRRARVPKEPKAAWSERGRILWDGKWSLLSPVIVLGGIYGGFVTPTEAAAVSCVYALVIGFLSERRLTLAALPRLLLSAGRISGMITAIVAMSAGFGVLVAQEHIATNLANWLFEHVHSAWLSLLVLNFAFFLLASVMDEIAIMVIMGPMLLAIATKFGIDPIHFGAIIVTNVTIGMATPPVGYCLFVGMAVSGLSLGRIARAIWPMILIMVAVLLLTTYIPGFSLLFVK